ncbi:hypothetical protein PIB30_005845 [Stylosanthes scabra]|uniref:Uncharacterized protein n=1 Tax=Stylosanthes scabra TaxID=79078 RepID=A0ABU6Z0W5_9FABA|nr:hypothetical protein [Stylosanthes scabra]
MADERASSPSSTSTEESDNSEATNVGPMHPHDMIDTDMVLGSTFQVERVNSGIKITPGNTPNRSATTPLTMGQGNLPPDRLPPNYFPPIMKSITRGAKVHNNPLYVSTSFTQSWPLPGITPMNLPQGLTSSTSTISSTGWAMPGVESTHDKCSSDTSNGVDTSWCFNRGRYKVESTHDKYSSDTSECIDTSWCYDWAESESIFLEMPSQISAEMTPPNDPVESFPVLRKQIEESYRVVVNMLIDQIATLLNPIIENNTAKIKQVAA